MKRQHCTVLVLALALAAGGALAQPPYGAGPEGWGPGYRGGPMGPARWMQLDVESRSERGAYVVAIRYAGIAPEELKVVEEGRDLHVYVERSAQQEGLQGRSFASSRMSRRVSLPPDADFSKAQRQEGPGFVTLLIPRRMPMGPGPRW